MQLLDKNENLMNDQEKLKLDLMRTMAFGKGYNLEDKNVQFDFKEGSNFERVAQAILNRFDIKLKTGFLNASIQKQELCKPEEEVKNQVKAKYTDQSSQSRQFIDPITGNIDVEEVPDKEEVSNEDDLPIEDEEFDEEADEEEEEEEDDLLNSDEDFLKELEEEEKEEKPKRKYNKKKKTKK
jgi:hypothetical protein